jgi:phage terminase large subunit-like protein
MKRLIVDQLIKHYDLVELAFDKWNSTHLCNQLAEEAPGLVMVEVPQTTGGMHPGSKKLEELVYGRQLRHGGNAVLRWAAGNVALLFDTNGNFRPDKKKSNDKGRIDPIVATVMALSRAAVHVVEAPSFWESTNV